MGVRGGLLALGLVPVLVACSFAGGSPTATPALQATPLAVTIKQRPSSALKAQPKVNLAPALAGVDGKAGIAILLPDGSLASAGSLQIAHAWSTSKVPVAIAALRRSMSFANLAWASSAITASDNASAQSLWDSMGGGRKAATATEAVLRAFGDGATRINPYVTHRGFTAFGQTQWSLGNQVRFVANLRCASGPAATKVFSLMGHIARDERWGLGIWSGAHFKGGWGPGTDGRYLVRQLGALPLRGGWVPVAIAVAPTSGNFNEGIADLGRITEWLWNHRNVLHPLHCERGN